MKISVVIPTYNEAHVLKLCLDSLLAQDALFEIIVVDDGSTDGTIDFLRTYQINHKQIFVIEQKHKGAGSARNLGVKQSTGDILVFVDADMTFEPNFVSNLVKPIVNKKAIGTFSKDEFVLNWKNIWSRCWNWNANLPDKRRLPLDYPDSQKVFRAILKSEFTKVNGFTPGGYTDDWSLSQKLGKEAQVAINAVFYHSNPETLAEVFTQSKWSAKRVYKGGVLGMIYALLRVNIFFSLINGVVKGIIYKDLRFILFKLVFDVGQTSGILDFYVNKKGTK